MVMIFPMLKLVTKAPPLIHDFNFFVSDHSEILHAPSHLASNDKKYFFKFFCPRTLSRRRLKSVKKCCFWLISTLFQQEARGDAPFLIVLK